jgi:predicted transcriptional regulator
VVYDSSLINFKRNLDDRLNLLLKYDRDPQVRSQYFSSLKQYRKLRKMKSLQYRQEIINKLDSLYESNPKEYWKLLDQLKSKDNSFSEDASHVPENEWYDYFKHLNEDTFTDKKIDKLLNDLEKDKIFNELDYIISEEEILKAIKDLKNNKAAGFYIIINEMRSVSIGKTIVQIV